MISHQWNNICLWKLCGGSTWITPKLGCAQMAISCKGDLLFLKNILTALIFTWNWVTAESDRRCKWSQSDSGRVCQTTSRGYNESLRCLFWDALQAQQEGQRQYSALVLRSNDLDETFPPSPLPPSFFPFFFISFLPFFFTSSFAYSYNRHPKSR